MNLATPTLSPSPQGGGKPARRDDEILSLNVSPSSPSPLWGGIKGGGISPHTLRHAA